MGASPACSDFGFGNATGKKTAPGVAGVAGVEHWKTDSYQSRVRKLDSSFQSCEQRRNCESTLRIGVIVRGGIVDATGGEAGYTSRRCHMGFPATKRDA